MSPNMEDNERPYLHRAVDSLGTDVTDTSEDLYEGESNSKTLTPSDLVRMATNAEARGFFDCDGHTIKSSPNNVNNNDDLDGPPLAMTPASQFGWSVSSQSRHGNSVNYPQPPHLVAGQRPSRPAGVRQPSNTHVRARRPHHHSSDHSVSGLARPQSSNHGRRHPNAEYKEDGLRSLWDEEKEQREGKLHGLFHVVNAVIDKAKATLISNAEAFADRHLPPYIEELLILINFPSRLVQEVIRVRLGYAKRMRDVAQQGVMIAEQMILQFQSLLKLAVKVKEVYHLAARPEPGWDLPPCIDEDFDRIVIESVRF